MSSDWKVAKTDAVVRSKAQWKSAGDKEQTAAQEPAEPLALGWSLPPPPLRLPDCDFESQLWSLGDS